jgi:hypothetical protein
MKSLALALLLVVLQCTTQGALTQADDAAATEAADEVTIDEIVAAWNARHDRVQSLHFEYTEDRIMLRVDELRLHRDRKLIIDGLRYRNEAEGDIFQEDEVRKEHFVQIYDGEVECNYFGYDEHSDRLHPSSYIHPTDREGYQSGAHFHENWAIFHTFRIRQPGYLAPRAEDWRLTGRMGRIGGRDCAIVEYLPELEQGRVYELWVDTSRDFIVLRKYTKWSQIDIEYESDPAMGWYPSKWIVNQYTSSANPTLAETTTYEVTSHNFNKPVDDSAFDTTSPAGTVVKDYTEDEVNYLSYLVREDGERREITHDEQLRGSNYSDWLVTESGQALLPPRSNLWRWLAAAVVLGVVGGWLVKRRKSAPT